MYKLLLVLASAAALKRPAPQRALAVRGGEIDPLQVGKGIVLASGIYGVFDPAGNLDKYGMKGNDKDNAMMRLTAWSQILYAAALNLDTESVHGQMAYHCVAFILIAQPCFEKFQSPKTADAIWMAVMAAIGYKTLDGTLNKWVAAALWLGNGAQFWLAPKSGIDLYEMKGVSKLGESLMSLWGGQALCVGTYLAALILEKSQSEAFAYSMIMNGVAALKYAMLEADDLKAPKTGPLAWAALSAGLAYKSLA